MSSGPNRIIAVTIPSDDFNDLTIEEAAASRFDLTVKQLQDISDGGYPVIIDADTESQFLLLKEVSENGYANINFYRINASDTLQAVHCLTISPDGKYGFTVEL